MKSDFEFNALRGFMRNEQLTAITESMYRYRWEGVTWADRLAWAADKLLDLGLGCVEHPDHSRTVVAFVHGTRRKRPPCIVIGVSALNPISPSAVDVYTGSGLIQLIPKGFINVADMAGQGPGTDLRAEA